MRDCSTLRAAGSSSLRHSPRNRSHRRQRKMVEAFVGKWKVDLSTTTGLEEFGAALGFNVEKMKGLANLSYCIEFGVSGDTITATVSYEADFPSHTYNFKLGDTFDYHAVDGSDPKLTVTMDGAKLVEDYKLGDATWQTIRQVDGTVMTSTTTARGKSVVQKLTKQ